jgi:hypothetical protein
MEIVLLTLVGGLIAGFLLTVLWMREQERLDEQGRKDADVFLSRKGHEPDFGPEYFRPDTGCDCVDHQEQCRDFPACQETGKYAEASRGKWVDVIRSWDGLPDNKPCLMVWYDLLDRWHNEATAWDKWSHSSEPADWYRQNQTE